MQLCEECFQSSQDFFENSVKPVFHLANLFARTQRKKQLDWLATNITSHHIRFLLVGANKFAKWKTGFSSNTGRNSAMRRDSLVFKSRQICSWENFIGNFITFELLNSSACHIYQSFLLYTDLFAFRK